MDNDAVITHQANDADSFCSTKSTSALIPLTVYTLGRFAVYRGEELIDDSAWKRRKAKTLFKLLLLAPQRQLLKDRVLEWLWPDQEPELALNNLHRTLFVLRRTLQPDLPNATASAYLWFKDGLLTLNPAAIAWVDLEEFERLFQLGQQAGNALPHYEAARALYQGEFLPEDIYEDWAGSQRQQLSTAYNFLLQQMARLYAQRAAYNEAITCLQELLGSDPSHEDACRELMGLYTQVGQRHQALQLYRQLRQTLRRELEVEPSAETTALYQAIAEDCWYPLPKVTAPPGLTKTRWPERLPHHTLVGRAGELTMLVGLLQQTELGRGRVVIISGEQGVGKTCLAEAVIQQAEARVMLILYGAAYEQEGHLPYGPFVEAIRSALTEQSLPLMRERLGPLSDDLARLLPELSEPGRSSQTSLQVERGHERQRLFDAVVASLAFLTQTDPQTRQTGYRPLLLVLDDLHAAGESSLQLLHYLARRVVNLPVLILCTVRAELAQRGTAIARLCQELTGQQLGLCLRLAPIAPAETAHLCATLLGGAVTPELSQLIYDLSEGNPFFVQEIVLALAETRQIEQTLAGWQLAPGLMVTTPGINAPRGGVVIPGRIHQVIGLRLERLSPAAYRLAGLAAVIGREFSYPLLQIISQLAHATLLDLLDEMISAYLVEETGAGYRFRHGLIRQVLYDELTTHRRIWLHGQVVQALERLFVDQLKEQAAIFVYHYERAERYELAFHYLMRAGDQAQSSYALREALDYYDRAMVLSQEHLELATAESMAGLLQRRAQTHLTLSDFEAAIVDLEQLLENNRRTSDRRLEGEALYQVGLAHYWAHRLERAAAYLDQALQLAESLRYQELRTKALKLRAILSSTQGEISPTLAMEVADAQDSSQSSPVEEHWGLAMLAHLRSDFDTALQHGQACLNLGQTLGHTFLALGGYFVVGMTYASQGHYQHALDHLLQALELSETAGDRFWRARLLNTIGWVYRELFDVERAIRYDQASLELARAGTPRLTEAEGNALANLATDYLLQKDYSQMRFFLEEGLRGSGEKPFMRWRYHTRLLILKGRLALAEANAPGALAAADEALAITQGRQAPKNLARAYRLRGEALLASSQMNEARAALHQALEVGLQLKCPALIWPCQLNLARLEEANDHPETAQRHYAAAAAVIDQVVANLNEPKLRQTFLAAPPIQLIRANTGVEFLT